jgi:hypothetical protein
LLGGAVTGSGEYKTTNFIPGKKYGKKEGKYLCLRQTAGSQHQAIARLLFFLLFSSSFAIDAFTLRDRTNAFFFLCVVAFLSSN